MAAFLANLMKPLRFSFKLSDSNTSDTGAAETSPMPQHSEDRIVRCQTASPWVGAAASSSTAQIERDLKNAQSLSPFDRIATSFQGSTQAFAYMCGSATDVMRTLGASEDLVLQNLGSSLDPESSDDCRRLAAENLDLKRKLEASSLDNLLQEKENLLLAINLEKKKRVGARSLSLSQGWVQDARNQTATVAVSARLEMDALSRSLSDERRANADLRAVVDTFRATGCDIAPIERFLQERAPDLQRQAYLEAKGKMLKKIISKYPDADMEYFADMGDVPDDVVLDDAWLQADENQFTFPSPFVASAPIVKKRRFHKA